MTVLMAVAVVWLERQHGTGAFVGEGTGVLLDRTAFGLLAQLRAKGGGACIGALGGTWGPGAHPLAFGDLAALVFIRCA